MLIALLTVLALLLKSLRQLQGRGQACVDDNNTHTTTPLNNKAIHKAKILKENKIINNFKKMSGILSGQLQKAVIQKDVVSDSEQSDNPSIITFKTGDKQCCHECNEKNVKVIASSGTHDHGSSKVKLKNIVDYKWEIKNYPGHLIAVHIDGKHVAYVINVNNKVSRVEGMVRVVNAQSGLRALIKGMSGEVLDLQFAHIEKERILASIDLNSLYVHQIDMRDGLLLCNLIIKIEDPLANYTPKYDKISWCPFVEVPDEDDEDSQLIVWARGSTFQCFNVNVLVSEHGIGKIQPSNISTGYLKFHDEALTISWVTLSPDGSTLGVGSTDGVIRFYQVYMHDKEPRCLHQWKPHDGKPVSSFFFLDNLTRNVSDTYWKFAITGANNNTELKVWDCATWQCLQTVTIVTENGNEQTSPRFIAEIDRTSSYMVISSLETRTCYVLQIVNNAGAKDAEQDSNAKNTSGSSLASNASAESVSKKRASQQIHSVIPLVYIKSISEFPLNSGILSFSIVDAAVRRYKCANDNYMCEELDDYDEETNSLYCVVVRMFIVQSKSMQECHILYQPTVTEQTDVKSTLSNESNAAANVSKDSAVLDVVVTASGSVADTINKTANGAIVDGNVEESVSPPGIQQSETSALEALLGITNSPASNNHLNLQTTTITTLKTTNTSVVSVAAAAAAEEIAEKSNSQNVSPATTAGSGKAFGGAQVNLMTPDAFSATNNDKKSPDSVSSDVLNTILMLASSVAGQTATPAATKPENVNLLNLVNNKIIEDQEQQKLQIQQTLEIQKKFMAMDNNTARSMAETLASGGSSPSREVQEIMSLQDYDKCVYNTEVAVLLDATAKSSVNTAIKAEEDLSNAEHEVKAHTATAGATNWPNVPVPVASSKHSAELQNAAILISQAVNASTVAGSLSNSNVAPTLINSNSVAGTLASATTTAAAATGATHVAGNDLAEINAKMSQLIDLVQMQSLQINNLQTELADMKKSHPLSSAKSLAEFSFKLEMQLSKLMEQYLKRYENEHKKKLAAFMAGREVQNRELRDSFIQIINQYILTQFSEVVSKVTAIEMQRQLAPMLAAKIDQFQQQLQLDVAQKLSTFDLMLKENIAHVCKSKSIIDTFGKSVLLGVQGSLQAAFIESMSSTLIPAYEKSSQNMFKQLHEAFSVGIKEFMEQFDNYLKHLQPVQDSTEEILNKFSGFRQHLDTILQKHRNSVNETMLETRKDVKSLEILLSRQIQESLRLEVRKCFENQAVALRSQTSTPAPFFDLRETIKMYLQQGQINKAFHQALLANDLNLVEYTLKSADHNAVFTPTCCLEQKVLLSLIQQISADMSNHNEVKQNYLAEALLAINTSDSITREHAPKVLQELYRNCQMFLINYPKSPQCSNVRMLMKAVQTFKDQF